MFRIDQLTFNCFGMIILNKLDVVMVVTDLNVCHFLFIA